MKGFSVIDSSGNLKLTSFGSGASLPDPVTVVHGGTGLTNVAQGDILYASAAGVLSRLAKDTGGTRVLSNLGTSNNPTWTDPVSGLSFLPVPTTRKVAWSEFITGAGVTPRANIWTSAVAATTSVTDATAHWGRYTTAAGAAGSAANYRSGEDWNWIDHGPTVVAYVRTGASIAGVRIWVVISNVGAGSITNADNQAALKGVGFRFSSASDSGMWVPWTADGTTQTIGTAVAAIAASTTYVLRFAVAAGGGSATFSVNGGTTQSVTIGSGALGTAMRINVQITTTDTSAKSLDLSSLYGEWS